MPALELTILAITYTALILAIFLQVLCFKRKIESIETIAFTISLLFLVVSISVSPLFEDSQTTTIPTLIGMSLIAVTALLSTLVERVHGIFPAYKRIHLAIGFFLIVGVITGSRAEYLFYIQSAIVIFLSYSIVFSMIVVQTTKPVRRYVHLEKSNRFFAVANVVSGKNVAGKFVGYELFYDLPVYKNFNAGAGVGHYRDHYWHTLTNETVQNISPTIGFDLNYRETNLFKIRGLYFNFSLPFRFYVSPLEKTQLGHSVVNRHFFENNIWLFIGYQF